MSDVVAIRANGSREIGSGHIRRTSLLARELALAGVEPVLLCNAQAPEIYPQLADFFAHVHIVQSEQMAVDLLMQRYGAQMRAILFDSYDVSAPEHRLYRSAVPYLAALDDLAARQMDVDLLVDVNLGRKASDYDGLVPAATRVHVGADYQILNPDFGRLRADSLHRRSTQTSVERVFIAIGGTDPLQMTEAALHSALRAGPDLQVDVVIGSASPGVAELRTFVATRSARVHLHIDATHVAQLMAQADLAIGAGGTMTWERNCLGLPTVILTVADNQMEIADHMEAARAAVVIDARAGYPDAAVTDALTKLIADHALCKTLSTNAAALSGDNGTQRIVKLLLQSED